MRPSVSIPRPGTDGSTVVEYVSDDPWTVAICRMALGFAAQAHDGGESDGRYDLVDRLVAEHWCSDDCTCGGDGARFNRELWQAIDPGFIRIELGESASRMSIRPPRREIGSAV